MVIQERKHFLSSTAISILVHVFVIALLVVFPPFDSSVRYQQVLVTFEDEVFPEPSEQRAEAEEPAPLDETEPVPEEVIAPEPEPVETPTPVEEAPVVEETTIEEAPEPETLASQTPTETESSAVTTPRQRAPAAVAPAVQSRVPSDDEVLGAVRDLLPGSSPRSSVAAAAQPADLAGMISNTSAIDNTQNVADFQEQTRVGEIPREQESSSAAAPQNPQQIQRAPNVFEELAELHELQEEMERAFGDTTQTESPGAQTPGASMDGFADARIQGEAGSRGRGLVSDGRLDLSGYLGNERGSDWPRSIRVEFEVDQAGFVRILNGLDLSVYTDIALALYRLFQGQVFVASAVVSMEGSIEFVLR